MQLTIGMMVKNEEKHLDECLKSLQPLLDNLDSELVIVDTGSTDSTVEIAKKYTDKVYFHKWNNNFSEMRNITIDYAKGDWFFCIDGDEVLDSTEEIIEFFKSGEYKKYYSGIMGLKNFTSSTDKNQYGLCETIRLFKNDGDYRYVGTVHNQPLYKEPTKRIMCTIDHYGYISDDLELMEKKFIRTSTILKEELKKDPENIYYRYQLAVSYYMHKDITEALEEMTTAYKKLNKNNKSLHKYVLNEYANILLANHLFKECEKLCEEELGTEKIDETYKIDLQFFLAKTQSLQKKYSDSIKSYCKFIKSIEDYENGKIKVNLSTKLLTHSEKEVAYNDIAIIEHFNKNYLDVIKYINKIENEKLYINLISLLIESLIKTENFLDLKKIYIDKILKMDLDLKKVFENELEKVVLNLKDKEETYNKISSIFSEEEDISDYIRLNKIRLSKDIKEKEKIYDYLCSNVEFNEEVNCYGELIYLGIKNNFDITLIIKNSSYEKCTEFLDFCNKKYDDFSECLFDYFNRNNDVEDKFLKNKVNIIICRALLILDKINDEENELIFERYIENGVELIQKVYTKYVLENEMVLELKNKEHEFFIYMMKANENKENNKKEYVRYLRLALKSNPFMKKQIEVVVRKIEEDKSNELEKLKNTFLNNINLLIESGNLTEAREALKMYRELYADDLESYSIESVILIMENKIDEAIDFLKSILDEKKNDIDSLYNLAYCYEINGDIKNAIRNYRKAWFYSEEELEKELLLKIYSLEYECADSYELEKIYNYYNQLRNYIIIKLYEDKNIKYEDVVKEEKTNLKRDMKVLFAPIEIAGQMNVYSEGLNNLGVDSYTLNGQKSYLKYNCDFSVDYNNINNYTLRKIVLLMAEFDVFHLFFGHTVLLNDNELDILKELNKKIVMNYWGSDIRIKSIAEKNNKYVKLKFEDEYEVVGNIKRISEKIDTCIVADKELYQYVYPYFKNIKFVSAAMILDEQNQNYESKSKSEHIRIVHAPTSRKIKGSDYIIKAVESLKNKYNLEFILVENMTNDEAKKIYRSADIIIDQIRIGTYGVFALESMMMGKPTITYIADSYRDGYPDELPIISANIDNIKEVLEDRIINIEETRLIGKKGIEYINKYHDANKIAGELIDIYNLL